MGIARVFLGLAEAPSARRGHALPYCPKKGLIRLGEMLEGAVVEAATHPHHRLKFAALPLRRASAFLGGSGAAVLQRIAASRAASRGCHTRSRRSKAELHRQGRAPRRLWPR